MSISLPIRARPIVPHTAANSANETISGTENVRALALSSAESVRITREIYGYQDIQGSVAQTLNTPGRLDVPRLIAGLLLARGENIQGNSSLFATSTILLDYLINEIY